MIIVHCPHCKKVVEWATAPERPFCSERCRIIDLGAWAEGAYAIASSPPDPSEFELEEH